MFIQKCLLPASFRQSSLNKSLLCFFNLLTNKNTRIKNDYMF
ncbi:Uncharacterized protein dnl_53880 [Desulfonema limicola]|uniref:Uncharacterized protein n=1 Tax=Desulfonema limicola TaxID=45656 RepID=A0A975GIW0_9BACT|nr:Uncharacterized protein dnl_53880 [Desulfonema limicola]